MAADADLYSKGDEVDRYTVLSKIGGSGMAEVYEVEDDTGNLYACKIYSPKAVPSYVTLEKIRSTLIDQVPEVPGLVRPKEVIELNDRRVVISDYIQGSSLRAILDGFFEHEKSLDPRLVASIADKILATLAAFPPLTVHGLIKPSNVILQGAIPEAPIKEDVKIFIIALGESRLLSFSKFASIQLSHGRDYYYMAPEYISSGGRVNSSADTYSVGVMMYEALAGQVPKKDPAPIADQVETIDPALADIIDRSISKKPEHRYQEAGNMRDAIRAVVPDLSEYDLPSSDEVLETIEEEDIFIISDEDAKLADGVEDVDVFSGIEPVQAEEFMETQDRVQEEGSELFDAGAAAEPEEPEEVEDLFAEEETEPEEAAIDVEPEIGEADEEPLIAEEIGEVEEAETIEPEREPEPELIEEEVEVAEEIKEEPPPPSPPREEAGFPWGTVFVVGIVAVLIALVIWNYYSTMPSEEGTVTPTPVVEETPVPSPVPATLEPDKKPEATPKQETPVPTPTPTPTPTPDPTEKKISALILAGEKQKKQKHYVSPAGNNLLDTVKQVESFKPDHPWAKEARTFMVAEFISLTETEIGKKKYGNAESFANDGLKVDSNNKKLKNLLALIQKEKNKPKPTACLDGMSLVWGGTLRMGSSPDDPMRRPGERSNDPIYVSSFCIDRFEYPNKAGAAPKIKVSWYEAKAACESQGKRLCKEKEWERACKGPENYRYPYGNDFNDTACNTADKEGVGRKLNVTGSSKNCRSKFGVYDMSGNVREWTASRIAPGNPAYVVKGGSAIRPDWAARCAIREFAMPGQTSSLIGFRCCADAKKTD